MVNICKLVLAVMLLLLVSCAGSSHLRVAPTVSCAANATYTGLMDHPVTLENGRWKGSPFVAGGASRPVVGLMEGFYLKGDLDKDGGDELAVVLWENSGGSGTFYYLAVLGRGGSNGCVNLATGLVGDRIRVKGGTIHDGKIELDVIRSGPYDPACCPSQGGIMTWELRQGRLVRTD